MPRDMPMGAAPVCVVIGAGFSRLTAAARARARGFQVKIVDRLQELGSRARMLRAPAKLVDQLLQADYARVLP